MSHSKKAFTLMEVLMTLALFLIVLQTMYMMFLLSQRSWDNYTARIAPRQELRRALTSMVNELRHGRDPFITKEDHGTRLVFWQPDAGETAYSWTDTGEDAGKIIRTNYANRRLLATAIGFVSFQSPKTDEVFIKVGSQQDNAVFLSQKVALRSKTGFFAQSENEKVK